MAWEVRFKASALREFQGLQRQAQVRVGRCLDALAENPRGHGSRKLEGGEGFHRVRAGDYRVIYAIDDTARVVMVVKVGHRGDVYRGR